LSDELGGDEDDEHEQLLDNIRDNVDEDIEYNVLDDLFDSDGYDSSTRDLVNFSLDRSRFTLVIQFPENLKNFYLQNKNREEYVKTVRDNLSKMTSNNIHMNFDENGFDVAYTVFFNVFEDYLNFGYFNYELYYKSCRRDIRRLLNPLAREDLNYRNRYNAEKLKLKILENISRLMLNPIETGNDLTATEMIYKMQFNDYYNFSDIKLGRYTINDSNKELTVNDTPRIEERGDIKLELKPQLLTKLLKIKKFIEEYVSVKIQDNFPNIAPFLFEKFGKRDSRTFSIFSLKTDDPENLKNPLYVAYDEDTLYNDKERYSGGKVEYYFKKRHAYAVQLFDSEKNSNPFIDVYYLYRGLDAEKMNELLFSPNLKEIYEEYKRLNDVDEIKKIMDVSKLEEDLNTLVIKEGFWWTSFLEDPSFKLYWECRNNNK
jgi:hypothetical protein